MTSWRFEVKLTCTGLKELFREEEKKFPMRPNPKLPFRPLRWEGSSQSGHLKILDQRLLPENCRYVKLTEVSEVFEAIRQLKVRGAPAIGACAAYAVVIASQKGESVEEKKKSALEAISFLSRARPTARNLFFALERLAEVLKRDFSSPEALLASLLQEARQIEEEDREACRKIGEYALELLPPKIKAMTHCNAGALATCGIGTALAPLYLAREEGREIHVFVPETRPLLQGARLTAWELVQAGIPVTVVVDSARAHVLRKGLVNCVIVGADRVVRNGDVANKIGTYELALAARENNVPFYVAAPTSTFDPSLGRGEEIVIEERDPSEVLSVPGGFRIAPREASGFNPAFDVTPSKLITAIITEKGILHPPFEKSIGELLA